MVLKSVVCSIFYLSEAWQAVLNGKTLLES